MSSDKRKTFQIKAQLSDVKSMKTFSNYLTSMARDHLTLKYGRILDLLKIPVQVEAITALAQFYDPPLRCFTFQDFQLAPTLEEFGRILDSPKKKLKPYKGLGEVPRLEDLASLLKIQVSDLKAHFKKERDSLGFQRGYLEKKATDFVKARDWESMGEILALLIFGLILFPNKPNFIDTAAISVFWAVRVNEEDPVPALLANIYYTLHLRYKRRGGLMLCCLPLLYLWFTSQIFKDVFLIKPMNDNEWAQKLRSLTENSIFWYARKINQREVIVSCGDFPNVPLIGPRGCINYNPMLAIRQLGYPIDRRPDSEVLKEFELHITDENSSSILQKVIQAWTQVHRKGTELRKRGITDKKPYSNWIKEHVKKNKLPFAIVSSTQPSSPAPIPTSIEEVDELKATISRLEKEKEDLELNFQKVSYERNEFKFLLKEEKKQCEKIKEAFKAEKEKKERISDTLAGVTGELKECNLKLDQAWKEISDWNGLWNHTLEQHKGVREGLEVRISDLNERLKESQTLASEECRLREETERMLHQLPSNWRELHDELRALKECGRRQKQSYEALKDINERAESQLQHLRNLSLQDQATMQELHQEAMKWKSKFSNLAGFANNVVWRIPKIHRRAYAVMHPNNTPAAVFDFVESCEVMLRNFKASLEEARKAKL
ncbi:hypothetical protein L195_g001247 [Trifolium pratense]|uniref:DUF7745 domain-containing protein n=1 Tax=Trifolium pratense TaxID=57577 RepID=A0A2K3NP50_TRIPR|nr:hypothetical protein L195_g001247 [Trifolium pratense]